MNWKVVEEWATREKFGIDGGLTAVAYRDELIKVARLAVAERDRAEREKKRADEWADSVFGPKPPGLSKALAMDDREGEVQTDERAEDGRFDWTIKDATSWANAAEKGKTAPPWLAQRYREWLIRCARFAVAQHERAERAEGRVAPDIPEKEAAAMAERKYVLDWSDIEEWAALGKFGVDGGLSSVQYRDDLIRCAKVAVAERERADELARERNKAIEEASSYPDRVEKLEKETHSNHEWLKAWLESLNLKYEKQQTRLVALTRRVDRLKGGPGGAA